jgi:hypothetical protein
MGNKSLGDLKVLADRPAKQSGRLAMFSPSFLFSTFHFLFISSRCDQRVGQVLPHPSARLSHDTSMGIRGWPIHYPDVHPGGMVGYRPTRRPSKLLSLQESINLVCIST